MQQKSRQTIRRSGPTASSSRTASAPARKRSPRPILAILTDEAAREYRRDRHLPGLVRVLPWELQDDSEAASLRILQLLRRALRIERQRGRAGHWTYDVNRHLGLVRAYKAETSRLAGIRRTAGEGMGAEPGSPEDGKAACQAIMSSLNSGLARASSGAATKS